MDKEYTIKDFIECVKENYDYDIVLDNISKPNTFENIFQNNFIKEESYEK